MNNRDHHSQRPSNPALERLAVFVGKWNKEITSMSFQADKDKTAVVRGRASFEWIEDGAFLVQHSEVPDSDFPRSISVIGPDDTAETYCMLYFDSRGVSRIYQMFLSADTWKLWRDFPGFSQHFVGTFNKDHNIMTARWETSSDGSNWKLDFEETYTRVESAKGQG